MVEGKPYRYGLMAAGFGVVALGLFIMMEEKPHVYGTMCVLGLLMVCAATVWSLCQCYPKVILVSSIEEKQPEEAVVSASDQLERLPVVMVCGDKSQSPGHQTSTSCPTLHLV